MPADEKKREMARMIQATGHLLHRYHIQRMLSEVDENAFRRLTPPQVHMIMTVRELGAASVKDLTRALRVKAPAVSTMVERLVELGILTREGNPEDRREVQIRISPSEEAFIQRLEQLGLQSSLALIDKLGPVYADMWYEVSCHLHRVLRAEESE